MKETTDKLVEKVKSYINRHKMIIPGCQVVAGVSGGPDSMCLLHILYRLREEFNITLHAIHINHGLRGEEADKDQRYVEDWCSINNIGFYAVSVNVNEYAVKNKLSVEEAGRELRYAEFQKFAETISKGPQTSEPKARINNCINNFSNNCSSVRISVTAKIAVAQNLNDQAETILMRVFRGTGLDGLTGMEPVNGSIIRPLLETSRDEIEEYCLRNGIQTRIDRTNLETVYTRNKIRLECIPYICENFNPGIVTGLVRMAKVLKEDRDFLLNESKKAFQECTGVNKIQTAANKAGIQKDQPKLVLELDLDKLREKHPAIKMRVFRLALEQIKGDLKGIEAGHIDSLSDLADSGMTGSEIHLPQNIRAVKSYRTIAIFINTGSKEKDNKDCDSANKLNIPGETLGLGGKIIIKASIIKLHRDSETLSDEYVSSHPKAMVQYLDYDKILSLNEDILVRTREDGDIISPLGMSGTKKLKDYFIDMKVPRNDRDTIPLIAVGKEIIWITGFRTSEKFKIDINSKTVLKIEIQ